MSLYYILLSAGIALLFLGIILTMIRFIQGPSLPDRIIALELISSSLIGVLSIYSIISGVKSILDVALVLSLVTFLGTMVFANYLVEEKKKK